MIHSRCRRQNPLHSLYLSGEPSTSASTSQHPLLVAPPRQAVATVEEMEPVTGYRYDHVFKLVLIGESGVGKTSLAQRFTSEAFPTEAPSTIGVDFSVRVVLSGNKRIKLQLWDTSGQESMRTIVPNYFRFAEAIILVYDSTDLRSFLKLSDWMSIVEKFGDPNAQIFIIGTKCDLERTRAVSSKMLRDFAKTINIPAFETSALSGVGVEEAFTFVKKTLMIHFDLGHVRSSMLLQGTGGGASSSRSGCC